MYRPWISHGSLELLKISSDSTYIRLWQRLRPSIPVASVHASAVHDCIPVGSPGAKRKVSFSQGHIAILNEGGEKWE